MNNSLSETQLQKIASQLTKLSPQLFEEQLAAMLKEPKKHLIHSVVKHIPREILIRCLMETIDVQCQGGMKMALDEEKKKTPGGVFMLLIKKSPDVTKDQHKAIQKAERDRQKDKRRTLNMFEKLDIDKVKITREMIAKPAEKKTDEHTKSTSQEILDSLL